MYNKSTCFGIQLEYTRFGQAVTATWFSQIDYGVKALIKQYNRFLQGKPTDWQLPVEILSIRFEGILRDMVADYGEFFEYVFTAKGYNIRNYVAHAFYIPQDYGMIEATLVFLCILRLTMFRPKGEEKICE